MTPQKSECPAATGQVAEENELDLSSVLPSRGSRNVLTSMQQALARAVQGRLAERYVVLENGRGGYVALTHDSAQIRCCADVVELWALARWSRL